MSKMEDKTEDKLLKAIKHYQDSITKYSKIGNDAKVLHAISRLDDMPITVSHLQDTGVGRTINALRKYEGEVGHASRAIVTKWKDMVAQEDSAEASSPPPPQEEDTSYQDDSDKYKVKNNYNSYHNDSDSKKSRHKEDRHEEKEREHGNSHRKHKSHSENKKNHHSEEKRHKKDKEDKHSESDRHQKKRKHAEDTPSSSKRRHYESDKDSEKKTHYESDLEKRRHYESDKESDKSDLCSSQEEETYTKEKEKSKHKSHSSSHHKSEKNEKHKSKSSDKQNGYSEKDHKSSHSSSHSSKDKKEKSENQEKSKSEKSSHSKSSSKSDSSRKSESSDSQKKSSPTKSVSFKNKSSSKSRRKGELSDDDGIGCESGASFAEALGMVGPIPTIRTSTKKKTSTASPTPSTSKPKPSVKLPPSSPVGPSLLTPNVKLKPLELNLQPNLLEITTNYKPLPNNFPDLDPFGSHITRQMTEEEALAVVITSKTQRTKVYSGNKTWKSVPSLFNLCVKVLQDNIDSLEYTGGVPYSILKPVLERATAEQLFNAENHNPYLIEETDELWELQCKKIFRGKIRKEYESWRDMYLRCCDEREAKLKSLTQTIKQSQDKSIPVRQTKLAYVDSVVKPPRGIAKKQAKFGTSQPLVTPSARLSAVAAPKTANAVTVPNPPAPRASAPSSGLIKPKKAPLMQKALAAIKSRFRR